MLCSVQVTEELLEPGEIGPAAISAKERILSEDVPTKPDGTEVNGNVDEADPETCPRCGSERIKRIARTGLLIKYIYPLFGRYPWKCGRCGFTSMMKKRTPSRRHRRHSCDEQESGATTSPNETPGSQL